MPGPFTNRHLYLAVVALQARAKRVDRTLEAYLLALWSLARSLRHESAFSVDGFLRLLEDALTAPVPPFRERWRDLPDNLGQYEARGAARWEGTILRQIRDLREMSEAGMSPGAGMYLLTAPRGSPWYHTAVAGYLEAGAAGHFGGAEWEGADGEREVDVVPLHEITWHDFMEFLLEGQWNE